MRKKNNRVLFALWAILVAMGVNNSDLLAAQMQSKPPVAKNSNKYVEGEILVKYKAGLSSQSIQSTASSIGSTSIEQVGKHLGIHKLMLPKGKSVAQAINELQSNPNIEYVQPNYIYHATALPNDPRFSQQWGLQNTGQTILNPSYPTNNPGSYGYDIDAQSAWDEITDCSSVIVAVLDTGINYTHQDLQTNMWDGSGSGYPNHGYDFIDNDNNPMPTGGGEHHGTHVAGIIGASGNNGIGISGVCWQIQIMSVRVLSATGGDTAGVISGIEFAADNGAKVINMSLGGEQPFDTLFNDAITYAKDRDVVVVVSGGNGGTDGISDNNDGTGDDGDPSTIELPCNFSQDNLICVAALDQAYQLASFSNYGSVSVDVGAPGTNIISSFPGPVITDTFASGWNLSGGWTSATCNSTPMLVNPPDWCGFSSFYANNVDARAYKTFDLSGVTAGNLSFNMFYDTEYNYDFVSLGYDNNGNDPFDGTNDVLLDFGTGSTLPYFFILNYDLTGCFTSSCTIGFRLTSDPTISYSGVGIFNFKIETIQPNSDTYENLSGTSMASPHVAGIAAMIRAFNPNYSYIQTVEAIENGGESISSLSGITTTGNAANAMGALAHIIQPTGLAAYVQ